MTREITPNLQQFICWKKGEGGGRIKANKRKFDRVFVSEYCTYNIHDVFQLRNPCRIICVLMPCNFMHELFRIVSSFFFFGYSILLNYIYVCVYSRILLCFKNSNLYVKIELDLYWACKIDSIHWICTHIGMCGKRIHDIRIPHVTNFSFLFSRIRRTVCHCVCHALVLCAQLRNHKTSKLHLNPNFGVILTNINLKQIISFEFAIELKWYNYWAHWMETPILFIF